MSTKLQSVRERLYKHQRVFMLVRGNGILKRWPAKVEDVLRGGARLRLEADGRELTVRFNDIEIPPETGRPPAEVVRLTSREEAKVAGADGVPEERVRVDTRSAPVVVSGAGPATRVAAPPPKQSIDALRSSLSSYRELGRELARDAGAALEVLDVHLAGLRSELAEVAAEIKAVEAERGALEGLQRQLGDS